VPLEIAGRGRPSTKWRYFAIEAAVSTKPDDSGYRHVEYKVSPYHDFAEGVRMRVKHNGTMIYKNVTGGVATFVSPDDTLRFSMDFKATTPGNSWISASFRTKNPEEGIVGGKMGHGDEEVANKLVLDLGSDDKMQLQYITDVAPETYMRYNHGPYEMGMPKRFTIQLERDRRVAWLQKYIPSNK
jgi:hypothetical protein